MNSTRLDLPEHTSVGAAMPEYRGGQGHRRAGQCVQRRAVTLGVLARRGGKRDILPSTLLLVPRQSDHC